MTIIHSKRHILIRAILHTLAYWGGITAVWYFFGTLAAIGAFIAYHVCFLFSGIGLRHMAEAEAAFDHDAEHTIELQAIKAAFYRMHGQKPPA